MSQIPEQIDHVIYTSSSLEKGMDEIEALLGVRPVIGGRHPNYGTHNALLSLGDSIYLEVLAPDPDLPEPKRGRWLASSFDLASRISTWVLRTADLKILHEQALQNGIELGPVEAGKRERPDGSVLNWTLTDPYALPYGGGIPFLISWGDTQHPAGSLPKAGLLIELIIEHPEPSVVQENLKILGVDIDVRLAEEFRIIAGVRTENGIIWIR